MFFLHSLPDTGMSDNVASNLAQLAQRPPVGDAIASTRNDNAMRRLVAAWLVHCPSNSDQSLQERLELMFRYQLVEALPLALQMVKREPKYLMVDPPQLVLAVLAVGRFGAEKDVPALETLLEDKTEFHHRPPANEPQGTLHPVQIRDVALAVVLHLTRQEPLTYGFLHARRNPQTVFDVATLGMENDERRAAAAAQWRASKHQQRRDDSAGR
jgi:hypothetical protein